MKNMLNPLGTSRKFILGLLGVTLTGMIFLTIHLLTNADEISSSDVHFWQFRSVDTMKFSRDLSREKLSDPTFDIVIDQQVKNIAKTGATHVAIATPYDEEFVPILTRWVQTARRYNLHVWFRGNFSGWEGWFGYQKISRDEHTQKTKDFIQKHPELFADGDVFSSCPECENGGPGDPRTTGDVDAYRAFLISEYKTTKASFKKIGKKVDANYHSMNGDVARLIMDKNTTAALDGIVVIDHYVPTTTKMKQDLEDIAKQSGGKIVLGEFGAPIPDINGNMSEEEQAQWMDEMLMTLANSDELVGLNYWVNHGGSTQIWNEDGSARKAVSVLTSFYLPEITTISIKNPLGDKIVNAQITVGKRVFAGNNGTILVPSVLLPAQNASIKAQGYITKNGLLDKNASLIVMEKDHENIAYKLKKFFILTFNLPQKN